MVALGAAFAVILISIAAELLHVRRTRRIAILAFGPTGRPRPWARLAPLLRIAALGLATWGLATLLAIAPKVHKLGPQASAGGLRHLLLVLDVSPSMTLKDAGVDRDKSRRQRAAELLASFFQRVPADLYRTSIVACYNGAKPVVEETKDIEVVRNILDDLPLRYAFPVGKTDIFSGLSEAARIARPWEPGSTTLMVVTDGDTVPATGMPKMPASIGHVVIVGVGDTKSGSFIDGQQSRQDASTLRQIAVRLGGVYHNGNEKHLSTALLTEITMSGRESRFEQLTLREYALAACGLGATIYGLLPLGLHGWGTSWMPGVRQRREAARSGSRRRKPAAATA
jgi:Ca-activated chloride channel family protein